MDLIIQKMLEYKVNRFFIFLLNITLISLLSCKTTKSETNVINGLNADNEAFQVVLIVYTNVDKSAGICTGSVISHNKVLTAANCVIPKRKTLAVLFQTLNEDESITAHEQKVLSYTVHDRFNIDDPSTFPYNLAILNLPAGTFDATPPLELVNQRPEEGTNVFLVGYGCFTTKERKVHLKKIDASTFDHPLDVVEKIVCKSKDPSTYFNRRIGENNITKSTLCPSNMIQVNQLQKQVDTNIKTPTGTDAAPSTGDAGGPLFKPTGLIIGTLSFYDETFKTDRVTCYTDLTQLENQKFIKHHTRINYAPIERRASCCKS